MLPAEKLGVNRRLLILCSKLNIFPCFFRNEGAQLSIQVSRNRAIVWKCTLTTAILYAIYINGRMLEKLIFDRPAGFAEHGNHIVRCVMSVIFSYWAFDGFLSHGVEKAIIFNYTHAIYGKGKRQESRGKSFMQDQLILHCPKMLYPLVIFIPILSLVYLDSPQVLHSALPREVQGIMSITICTMYEFYVALFWMGQAHMFVMLHTPFLQLCEDQMETELEFKRKLNVSELERKVEVLKKVQVGMKIHGVGNGNSIFAHKVLNILLGIASFFYFIRLIEHVPGIALVYLALGLDSVSFHCVQWDKAHKIPSLMDDLKRGILLSLGGKWNTDGIHSACVRRKVKSVPLCGVPSGPFRVLERDSTLLFADFVLSQLISLLLM